MAASFGGRPQRASHLRDVQNGERKNRIREDLRRTMEVRRPIAARRTPARIEGGFGGGLQDLQFSDGPQQSRIFRKFPASPLQSSTGVASHTRGLSAGPFRSRLIAKT